MRQLRFLVWFVAAAVSGSAAVINLSPTGGSITTLTGGSSGWGFDISNDSPVNWIAFTTSFLVNETNPGLGSYIDLIGPQGGPVNFALGPNSPWSQSFDALLGTGLGMYTVDPAAPAGAVDSGDIRVAWESFAGDPSTCNCIPAEFSADIPFQVTAVDAPEPGAAFLFLGGGLCLLAGRFWRRRTLACLVAFAGSVLTLPAQTDSFITIYGTTNSQNTNYCAFPGQPACASGGNIYCTVASDNTARTDPYTALPICDLGGFACTAFQPSLALSIPTPFDITFLVATDLHLLNGWGITNKEHVLHVNAMNVLPNLGLKWSDAGGGMDNIAIGNPLALLTTGDDTHYGHSWELAAFRLLYEQGRTIESIHYPVLPGYGNHDIDGSCYLANCSRRMFDYIGTAPVCAGTSMDGGSRNYSWDWGPVHFVQLNRWAGATDMGTDDATNVTITHPSGLPWLVTDLLTHVGLSGRPVVILQHHGFESGESDGSIIWWTADDQKNFLNILKPYNVIGIFTGHRHTTGSIATANSTDVGKNFDNFVGGAGGQNGHGEFFAVRLTEKFMDVVPFQWTEDQNQNKPQIVSIGSGDESFNDSTNGCRKWIGPPLAAVPLTVSLDASIKNGIIVRNNSGSTLQGPFALKFQLKTDPSIVKPVYPPPALWLKSVSFVDNCSRQGSVYQELGVNQLAPGQQVEVTFNLSASPNQIVPYTPPPYTAADFTVVTLGGDSLVASTGHVTLSGTTAQQIGITTAFNRNIGFTYSADQNWLKVTADGSQTPATLTVQVDPAATSLTRSALLKIHPSDSSYSDTQVRIDLAKVQVTVNSSLGDPISVDGSRLAVPHTFLWAPSDVHTLNAVDRDLSASVSDRFSSWSDGGAQSHDITVGLASASYTATYHEYDEVSYTVAPAGGGQVTLPPSPDGFYRSGSRLDVGERPSPNYVFSNFTGVPVPSTDHFSMTITGPLSFAANFIAVGHYSVTTSLGASGSETVDGRQYTGPATVQWDQGTPHTFSVPQIVPGPPGTRDLFTGWNDGINTLSRTVTAGAVTSYIAQYQRQYFVTTSVSPSSGGTLTGGGWYNDQAPATLSSTAANGFHFGAFSGDVTGSQNPATLTVAKASSVVANFTPGTPVLSATPGPRNDSDPSVSNFTFVLGNSGLGAAVNAQIDSVTARTVAGTGTVSVAGLPLVFGTILPQQSASQALTIQWPQSATRVAFTVQFSANGGGYHSQTTFYVLR